MTRQPVQGRSPTVLLLLALAVCAAGCGAGARATPGDIGTGSPPGPTASPAAATPGATAVPTPTVPPRESPADQPPAAVLDTGAGGATPGELGSWTWGGAGDSAPWIVPADAAPAVPAGPLTVAFDPGVVPETWQARWAPVAGGQPGEIRGSAEGRGPVTLEAPDVPGDWALAVDASFGEGRSGAWSWRVEVAP